MSANETKKERKDIGKKLSSKRKLLEMSRYRISKMTGLTITQVKSIDEGEKSYTVDSLIQYATALNIPIF